MSRARLCLHFAALFAPLALIAAWMQLSSPEYMISRFAGFRVLGSVAVIAAQFAALLCWHALSRRAQEGHGAWLTGIGMATTTHVLFAVFLLLPICVFVGGAEQVGDTLKFSDIVLQVSLFFVTSVFELGALSFPVTMLLAHWIVVLRRKELLDHVA